VHAARYARVALRAAARDAESGYRRLARAAARGRAGGYGGALEATRDAEAAVQSAMAGLGALGYEIR
jgi:hypothetical protein